MDGDECLNRSWKMFGLRFTEPGTLTTRGAGTRIVRCKVSFVIICFTSVLHLSVGAECAAPLVDPVICLRQHENPTAKCRVLGGRNASGSSYLGSSFWMDRCRAHHLSVSRSAPASAI
jgi:hypothetical protein